MAHFQEFTTRLICHFGFGVMAFQSSYVSVFLSLRIMNLEGAIDLADGAHSGTLINH